MTVVPMEKEHTDTLAMLEKQCFSSPWSREALLYETENPAALFFTALEDGEILGYGGMHYACDEFYIDNIAVFERFRKKGVGTAIIEKLCREAESRGGTFISLEVRVSNENAVRLYKKAGFGEEGIRKDFYSSPREDALILTRRFNEDSE